MPKNAKAHPAVRATQLRIKRKQLMESAHKLKATKPELATKIVKTVKKIHKVVKSLESAATPPKLTTTSAFKALVNALTSVFEEVDFNATYEITSVKPNDGEADKDVMGIVQVNLSKAMSKDVYGEVEDMFAEATADTVHLDKRSTNGKALTFLLFK